MSSGFSANQFDGAFKSQRLQNWDTPKQFKARPSAKLGQTSIIVDDSGHLLPGFKMRDSSWPDFKGTWDLPARLPAHSVCPTARSKQGLSRLRAWGVTTPRITDPPAESSTDTQAQDASTQQPEAALHLEDSGQTQSPNHERPISTGESEGTPTKDPAATSRTSASSPGGQASATGRTFAPLTTGRTSAPPPPGEPLTPPPQGGPTYIQINGK